MCCWNIHINPMNSKSRAFILAGTAFLLGNLGGCAHRNAAIYHQRGLDRYVLGAQEYENGRTNVAIIDLKAALRENPDLTMAHVILGDIYKSRDDFHDAADQYRDAVRLDPYDSKNQYNLGLAYQFLNRFQEAIDCYLRSLNLNPEDPDSTMNLGLIYLDMNQPDDALKLMRRAVELAPKSSPAHCNLGVALEAKKNYLAAEREFRRAVELDSDSAVPLMNLAQDLIEQNRGAEAARVMQAAIKISDTTSARKRYGDALVLAQRDDDAYRQYAEAVRRNPNYWQALSEAGLIVIRKYTAGANLDERLRSQAIAIWQRSLQIQQDQPAIAALVRRWNQSGKVLP
jgi:tetratricopeptide (TPR) repeat protein